MTVWIVVAGWNYEGDYVKGVYLEKEKAEEVARSNERKNGGSYDYADAEEWVVIS